MKHSHLRRHHAAGQKKHRISYPRKPANTTAVEATIVQREPDAAYPEALSAVADAAAAQMFDLPLGETLRVAYTVVQKHQERQTRRAIVSDATTVLREHLARLDETVDDV